MFLDELSPLLGRRQNVLVASQPESPLVAGCFPEVPMQRGRLRVMIRYPLVVLVEQARLSQQEAAQKMGLSTGQVRRVLKRYPESGHRLESLACQSRHSAWNALPR
jgi:hypothetical protein